ncbi:MAG: phage tail assembly protein [Aeromonadaceae bacterium]
MITIKLPTPIKRKEGPNGENNDISEVMMREPKGGELRGLETLALIRMDYASHRTLIPRICPQITANDIDAMDPKTLLAVQQELVGFFVE